MNCSLENAITLVGTNTLNGAEIALFNVKEGSTDTLRLNALYGNEVAFRRVFDGSKIHWESFTENGNHYDIVNPHRKAVLEGFYKKLVKKAIDAYTELLDEEVEDEDEDEDDVGYRVVASI